MVPCSCHYRELCQLNFPKYGLEDDIKHTYIVNFYDIEGHLLFVETYDKFQDYKILSKRLDPKYKNKARPDFIKIYDNFKMGVCVSITHNKIPITSNKYQGDNTFEAIITKFSSKIDVDWCRQNRDKIKFVDSTTKDIGCLIL